MNSIQLTNSALDVGLQWTARILSVLLVGLVVVIFIGDGGFNPLKLTPVEAVQMFFFLTACIGMLVAWRWELIGGAISLAAMLGFFAVQVAVTGGLPGGPVIHLMLLPGLIFMVSSAMQRFTSVLGTESQ